MTDSGPDPLVPTAAAELPPPPAEVAPSRRLPPLEDARLDGRVVPYWWLSGLVSTAVIVAVLLGLLATFRIELRARQMFDAAWWLAYGLGGLKLAWTVVAPPLSWRRWRWGIDDELLTLRWGIISHYERVIPISRLQHVDLTRGPIERLFGLTTLVVHTAGTSAASFDLPGLGDATARALRDRILAARGDDVV